MALEKEKRELEWGYPRKTGYRPDTNPHHNNGRANNHHGSTGHRVRVRSNRRALHENYRGSSHDSCRESCCDDCQHEQFHQLPMLLLRALIFS
jgi:hypothetical protein